MCRQLTLIDNHFIPKSLENVALAYKYDYLKILFKKHPYILFNNVSVFGPFPEPTVPWDISEAQKLAIYNQGVTKVLYWIKTRIIINLSSINYKTLDVLVRIATGMLNKCDIPEETKILFHDNMVKNLYAEYNSCVESTLPF